MRLEMKVLAPLQIYMPVVMENVRFSNIRQNPHIKSPYEIGKYCNSIQSGSNVHSQLFCSEQIEWTHVKHMRSHIFATIDTYDKEVYLYHSNASQCLDTYGPNQFYWWWL